MVITGVHDDTVYERVEDQLAHPTVARRVPDKPLDDILRRDACTEVAAQHHVRLRRVGARHGRLVVPDVD